MTTTAEPDNLPYLPIASLDASRMSIMPRLDPIDPFIKWEANGEAMAADQAEFDGLLVGDHAAVMSFYGGFGLAAYHRMCMDRITKAYADEDKPVPIAIVGASVSQIFRGRYDALARRHEEAWIAALFASPEPSTVHTITFAKQSNGVVHFDCETYDRRDWPLSGNTADLIMVDEYAFGDTHPAAWSSDFGDLELRTLAAWSDALVEKKPELPDPSGLPQINNRAARRRAGRKERPCRMQTPPRHR